MSESASKRERHCSTEKDPAALLRDSKRICLPIEQAEYTRIMGEACAFRQFLDRMITQHPELFPAAITHGYQLHDILPPSKKMTAVHLRRIKVVERAHPDGNVFTIVPSFVLPYMMGYTDEVEKALFLRGKFGIPYWGLTRVFGHNDLYWERLELGLGRNSVVGTTVKRADRLPQDLLADEKHTRLNGETVYVATTVGNDCVLGAAVALHADEKDLTDAYQQFKREAQDVQPDYQPQTVNTDGWLPTQLAWQRLFAHITLIVCFLHAFLKIRDRCKRMEQHFAAICKRVWEVYHATHPQQFMERCLELKDWACATLPAGAGRDAVLKLCAHAPEFLKAFDHPTAHRTSNMLDRLMDHMDRRFYSARYFHGHLMTAEYAVRAGALLTNFQPYCPRAAVTERYQSPAHKLNGFIYHDNWLHNLLISASRGGYWHDHRIR